MERESKMCFSGEFVYSFGKNGMGLSDEFKKLGYDIEYLSKNNHVYLVDAMIDAADDVYDLKFKVVPHSTNEWLFNDNNKYAWFSTYRNKVDEQTEVIDDSEYVDYEEIPTEEKSEQFIFEKDDTVIKTCKNCDNTFNFSKEESINGYFTCPECGNKISC